MSITTQVATPAAIVAGQAAVQAAVAPQQVNQQAKVTPEQAKRLIECAIMRRMMELQEQQQPQQVQAQTVDQNANLLQIVEVIQQLVNFIGELVKNLVNNQKAADPAQTPAADPAADPAQTPAADPAQTPAQTPAADPAQTPAQDPTSAPVQESTIIDKEKMDGKFNAADKDGNSIVTLEEYQEYYAKRAVTGTNIELYEGSPIKAALYQEAKHVFKQFAKENVVGELELSKDRFDNLVKYYDSLDSNADGKSINELDIVKDIISVKDGKNEIKDVFGRKLEEILDTMG